MSSPNRPRFVSGSTVREVLIVVIGILIAFSLDAWWDSTSVHSAHRDQSLLVLDELRETENALVTSMQSHRRLYARTMEIVEQLDDLRDGEQVSIPDTVLAVLMVQHTADIGTPSLEAFLDSGGATLLDDPEDRATVRSWPTVIEDTVDDQVFLRDYYTVPLSVYLRDNYDLGRAEYTSLAYQASIVFDDPGMASEVEYGLVDLKSESTLLNLLNARVSIEHFMTNSLSRVLERNRELIRIFESV